MGEFGPCLGFDPVGKAGNHAVKQVDLLVGITVGTGHEQVGDPPKDFRLLVGRSGRECIFDFCDQRSLCRHHVNTAPIISITGINSPAGITIGLGAGGALFVNFDRPDG